MAETGALALRRSDALATVRTTVRLSFFLGWQDVRLMYRRSILGQFWITLSMAVTFVAIGVVFGLIFHSPIVGYLPYVGCGLVFFTFMSTILNEGSTSFIVAQPFILQLPLPPVIYFLRVVWKTVFILAHNAVALVVLLFFFPQGISGATLMVVPGVVVTAVAISGIGLAVAMLATRYRDVPQVIGAAMQVAFYVTPIIWLPTAIPERARSWLLDWNPFFHLMQVMRQPVLNVYPTGREWVAALAIAGGCVAIGAAAYWWKRRELAFWV